MNNRKPPFVVANVPETAVNKYAALVRDAEVDEADKLHFHIGHPLRAPEFLDLIKDLTLRGAGYERRLLERVLDDIPYYLPKGGYSKNAPPRFLGKIVELFGERRDAYSYAIINGGASEARRLFYRALSLFLRERPARVAAMGEPPDCADDFPDVETLAVADPSRLLDEIDSSIAEGAPIFLALERAPDDGLFSEIARRSRAGELFVATFYERERELVQLSNALDPNFSMRFVAPNAAFDAPLDGTLLVAAAPDDYLAAFNQACFQLKGSAPQSEIVALEAATADNEDDPTLKQTALGVLSLRDDALENNFLDAFARHRPEYDRNSLIAVSGGSRTALGFLGWRCGIRRALAFDAGWTYDHCFPVVETAPVSSNGEPDVTRALAMMDQLTSRDDAWSSEGAALINSPHNATGSALSDEDHLALLRGALERDFRVVDDLSYDNVGPRLEYPFASSTALLAERDGLPSDLRARVITVRSLSKTIAFAGARLAVAEIRDDDLRKAFRRAIRDIPAHKAGLTAATHLFRNKVEELEAAHRLRNKILWERNEAIAHASESVSDTENPLGARVTRSSGSLYAVLRVERAPEDFDADAVAERLARLGFGVVPMTAYVKREDSRRRFRAAFRVTLGGIDGADALAAKTRRLILALNRIVAR